MQKIKIFNILKYKIYFFKFNFYTIFIKNIYIPGCNLIYYILKLYLFFIKLSIFIFIFLVDDILKSIKIYLILMINSKLNYFKFLENIILK